MMKDYSPRKYVLFLLWDWTYQVCLWETHAFTSAIDASLFQSTSHPDPSTLLHTAKRQGKASFLFKNVITDVLSHDISFLHLRTIPFEQLSSKPTTRESAKGTC